ncbi:hypothetical protein [Bradyrhizobium sp. CCGE-LA001]|uniref:hypothetical protein n=1 Tax=Bradyrhizobium sp. CCGE-LA001 TaxID=1223566 RepID=UPI0002AAD12A|nr:hypothetical protein [Bradyrhizobium sp. CCGE-LA001]
MAGEAAGSRHAAASALRGRERLSDEWLGPLAPRGADAAGPSLKLLLLSHGQPRQCAKCTDSRLINLVRLLAGQAARDFVQAETDNRKHDRLPD